MPNHQPYVSQSRNQSSNGTATASSNTSSTYGTSSQSFSYAKASASTADPYGPPRTATNTNNVYGTPTSSGASAYSSSSGYQNRMSAGRNTTSSTSAYPGHSTISASSSSYSNNPYGPPPSTSVSMNTSTVYGNDSSHATSASSSAYSSHPPPSSSPSALPNFSNALDLNNGVISTYPAKTQGPRMSLVDSTTYSGGATNGLVSEGNPVRCHKVDYEIKGHEMQVVEIELDPNETVIGEAGAMMFMEDGIKFDTKFGDGSTPKQGFFKKLLAAGGRLLTGESLFITHFTNDNTSDKARVGFAAPYPGSIVPVNLANMSGQTIYCQRDAFLCAALGTKLSIGFNKRIGSGLFGGEGFILQKLEGDGMAFLHAGGTIVRRELNNERIRLDTGCLVAFTPQGIDFEIMMVPGLKTMFFGGEGLFLAVLKGTGTIWMQSLPFSRMADRIINSAPSAGGRRVGEGSRLTGSIGDLIDGDGFGRMY